MNKKEEGAVAQKRPMRAPRSRAERLSMVRNVIKGELETLRREVQLCDSLEGELDGAGKLIERMENETVLHDTISGAIIDFLGHLTGQPGTVKLGDKHDAQAVMDLLKEWSKIRGLSFDNAAVRSWDRFITIHTLKEGRSHAEGGSDTREDGDVS